MQTPRRVNRRAEPAAETVRNPHDTATDVDSDFIGPARLRDFRLFRNATVAPHVQANIKALEPPLYRCSSH